jgi:putative toxin-antitoxin system antitoxin component (TIGR02293 family)
MATTTERQQSAESHPPRQRHAAPRATSNQRAETEVMRRATEVLGDRPSAMRWLGTPVRDLDYATPISLLHNAKGREAVLSVLGRLEHGVL